MAVMPAQWPAFAKASSLEPFQWGWADCMLDVADWLQAASGRDLGAQWRGRYATAEECRALFRARGGLARAMRQDAAAAGLIETDAPAPGDVGIVRAFPAEFKGGHRRLFPMGAIMMASGRWRVRGLVGHITGDYPVVVAWRLPCRR